MPAIDAGPSPVFARLIRRLIRPGSVAGNPRHRDAPGVSPMHRAAAALFRECGLPAPCLMVASSPEAWSKLATRASMIRHGVSPWMSVLLAGTGIPFIALSAGCSALLVRQGVMPATIWHDTLFLWTAASTTVAGYAGFGMLLCPRLALRKVWRQHVETSGLQDSVIRLGVASSPRILAAALCVLRSTLHPVVQRAVTIGVPDMERILRGGMAAEIRVPALDLATPIGWLSHLTSVHGPSSPLVAAYTALHLGADELAIIGNLVIVLPSRRQGAADLDHPPVRPSMEDLFLAGIRKAPVSMPRLPLRTPERVR